jgi:NADH-quinone oxidoreductase subunit J
MLELIVNLNFYIFSSIALCSSICMIMATNAVHSVLYLILVYIAIVAVVLLLGVEFIPILLIVVYVGAIAVLFLFVVMMINIEEQELEESLYDYTVMGILTIYGLSVEFGIFLTESMHGLSLTENSISSIDIFNRMSNDIESIGFLLFMDYKLEFVLSGVILLLAMIGAIVITLYHRNTLKRQLVYQQLGRNYVETIRLKILK